MNDLRARALDLCMSEAMPFMQSYQYRTIHPVADVIHDQFFVQLRGQLYAGDEITICRMDSATAGRRDAKLLEVGKVRVVSSGPNVDAVPLVLTGSIVYVGEQEDVMVDGAFSVEEKVAMLNGDAPVKRGPGRPPKVHEAA
jgi:hypothetical protein